VASGTIASVLPDHVREHYDRLSSLYHAFWGEHIHHGLWAEGRESLSPAEAQVALIENLARAAGIPEGASVLDVGCGLGGSSFWLALNRGCMVQGVTLSPVQCRLATKRAKELGLDHQVRFEVADANALGGAAASFDAIWVVECSEHLADKPRFLDTCHRLLKPGGVLALCAWLRGEDLTGEGANLVRDICEGMLCPSLASRSEYERWMTEAGFGAIETKDLTRQVERTWEVCSGILSRVHIDRMLGWIDPASRRFLEAFPLMRRAYAENAMAYGLFVAGASPYQVSD